MSETQGNPAPAMAENYEKNVVTYTTGSFAALLLEHVNPQPGIMHLIWPAARAF